jgi:Tol biopolymer transport system component
VFDPEFVFECPSGAGSCRVRPIDFGPGDDRLILVLFGTGLRRAVQTGRVFIGGVEVTPEYIGSQNQYPGLDQVNVTIPRSLAGRGSVDVVVSAAGLTSNAVTISTASAAAEPLPNATEIRTIVTAGSGELARPSYSPDGQWIIFDRRDERSIWQVRRMPASGTGPEECLTCGRADMPGHNGSARVHPGGRYIVFTSEQANHAPAAAASITPGAGFYHDIVVLDLNTREFHRVRTVRSAPTEGAIPPNPGGTLFVRFSPDGTRLLWGDVEGTATPGLSPPSRFGNYRIGVAQFETSPAPRLVNLMFYNPGPRPEFFEIQGWSADGGAIYTACTPYANQDENALDFCRFHLSTGTLEGLSGTSGTNGEPAEYEEHGEGSPDGRLIAYMSSGGHGIETTFFLNWLRTDLWLMRPDGSERKQVTFYNVPGRRESLPAGARAIVSEMSWSPGGDAVIAAVFFDNPPGTRDEHAIVVFRIGQ